MSIDTVDKFILKARDDFKNKMDGLSGGVLNDIGTALEIDAGLAEAKICDRIQRAEKPEEKQALQTLKSYIGIVEKIKGIPRSARGFLIKKLDAIVSCQKET